MSAFGELSNTPIFLVQTKDDDWAEFVAPSIAEALEMAKLELDKGHRHVRVLVLTSVVVWEDSLR